MFMYYYEGHGVLAGYRVSMNEAIRISEQRATTHAKHDTGMKCVIVVCKYRIMIKQGECETMTPVSLILLQVDARHGNFKGTYLYHVLY